MAGGEGAYATELLGEGRMAGIMSRGTVTAANHDSTRSAPN